MKTYHQSVLKIAEGLKCFQLISEEFVSANKHFQGRRNFVEERYIYFLFSFLVGESPKIFYSRISYVFFISSYGREDNLSAIS